MKCGSRRLLTWRLSSRLRLRNAECENDRPIARTRYVPLYLDASNGSMNKAAAKSPSIISYDSAAALSALSNNGRAVFVHRFDRGTELTGYMKLKLWVSTDSSDDMDLFIGVHKLDRRGVEVHLPDFNHIENGRVASGWLRVSHRELDERCSTPYQPWLKHERLLKLKPGEIVPVEIEIWPSSTLFRSGEMLQVTIQGSEVPRPPLMALSAEHTANRYEHKELVNRGQHMIYCGGQYDSHLLVPVDWPTLPEDGLRREQALHCIGYNGRFKTLPIGEILHQPNRQRNCIRCSGGSGDGA